jgi:hypothetical protein
MSLGPRSLLIVLLTCALVVVPVAMFVVRPCMEGFLEGFPRGVRDAVIIGVSLLLCVVGLGVAEGILVRWRRRRKRDEAEEKPR